MTSTLTAWIDAAADDRDEAPADILTVFRDESDGDERPERKSRQTITNATVTVAEKEKHVEPHSMQRIIADIQRATGGWPRRVGDLLFVHDRDDVDFLMKTESLMGWLGTATGSPPTFHSGAAMHSAKHVFEELRRLAQNYEGVELLPHEPPMANHYYACTMPTAGDGTTLAGLVDRYSPETPIDASLIAAAFATPFWGGESGKRPAFLITSDAGRGAGKTTLASHIGLLAGGMLELSANEDAAIIKQRLLSAEGMRRRVAILDNVKSLRFSWAELEALITAPTISGKRMYHGEASRPNTLVYLLTLNGASLSRDLAQRCVVIKLAAPKRTATWEEDTRDFIVANREALVADCIALLRCRRDPLDRYSRWASWERDVLERLPSPNDIQATILERQSIADVEDEESGIVQEYFRGRLAELGYDVDSAAVFVPSKVAGDWFNAATNERHSTTAVTRRLKQGIIEGTIRLLTVNSCNAHGRGFLWRGPASNASTMPYRDIDSRLLRQDR